MAVALQQVPEGVGTLLLRRVAALSEGFTTVACQEAKIFLEEIGT